MGVARELIDDGYNAQKYRDAYADTSFCIRPPSVENLEMDPTTLLPPKTITKKAGRPKKGRPQRKRVASAGEGHTSSFYNVRSSAPGPGAAAAGAGAAEPALSQPTLSQQS